METKPIHILVCVKSVMLETPGEGSARSQGPVELNPFDRPALEMALRLKESHGGRITVLSMGPESAQFGLMEAMAMGVDRGILLSDPFLAGSDTLATSTALCAAIQRLTPWDMAFFGMRTADSDTGQVGPMASVLLDVPLISGVRSMELHGSSVQVIRRQDGIIEQWEVPFPCVLTLDPACATPRDLSMTGIRFASGLERLEVWGIQDVGLNPSQVGHAGSMTQVLSMNRVERERFCTFLEGSPADQAGALVSFFLSQGLMES